MNDIPGEQTRAGELEGQIHVWFCAPEAISDRRALDYYASLLSAGERERWRRFRFDRDRHRFLVSHALVRRALSRYADVHPSAWRFASSEHGRAEIAAPDTGAPLRFNLTHTEGLSACVVTLATDCGIDAEIISTHRNAAGIARKMFAEAEQQALARLRGRAYTERFLAYWTLREAYCKALGVGLHRITRNFDFDLQNGKQPGIRFSSESGDNSADWQFDLVTPTTDHLMAIAVRRPNLPDQDLVVRRMEP